MNFPGVSPTQQYLIDNAVFYGGRTYEQAYEEVVGTTPTASIEPTPTTSPTNVYMDSEEVVNSGDKREIPEVEQSWGYGVDDVTKDMTTVDTNTGLLGAHAGGLLDRAAQAAFKPYALMRAVQGFVEPEYEAGTPTESFKKVVDWWDNFNLEGLIAEPTYSNESLFAQSLDEGSYTDMGDYSYGTIDGIGVESPY